MSASMCMMLSAARTGTVLFSTTILLDCAISAIIRAALSTYLRSAARPADWKSGLLSDLKYVNVYFW